MPCIRLNERDWLCFGGPRLDIEVDGRRYAFEWHPYRGPMRLNRQTEDVCSRQPGEPSTFWRAVTWWDKQGRRMKDGLCVWNRERGAKYKTVGVGRHREIVGVDLGERCDVAACV